ncbi:hypothetical protein V6N13_148707 [Hibiscus sabdariffa]|uniref:Uncharacterized protein n=1 Tax=Hibiscus sabdariffa TaxID=183260 RepID=A0ABR2EJM0_9ROSI
MPFKGTSQINKRIECCACLSDWDLSALLSQTLAFLVGNANCMMSSLGRRTDPGRNNFSEHCSRKGMVSHVPHEVHATATACSALGGSLY